MSQLRLLLPAVHDFSVGCVTRVNTLVLKQSPALAGNANRQYDCGVRHYSFDANEMDVTRLCLSGAAPLTLSLKGVGPADYYHLLFDATFGRQAPPGIGNL